MGFITLGHIATNFDGKTWLGIGGIVLMLVIFFKGMGTKEGGSGGSGNGNSKTGSSTTSTNTSTTNTTNNNNSVN